MCLSTNEEPWTERVVNQICVAVAGYNETINRKKCTCINNFKYREHQNKYTKSSWEEKYDSISDYCTLDPHCAGTSSTFKSIYTRIMWLLFSPFQKEKKEEKRFCLGAGSVLFLITLWNLVLFLWIIKVSLFSKQDVRRENKWKASF